MCVCMCVCFSHSTMCMYRCKNKCLYIIHIIYTYICITCIAINKLHNFNSIRKL